MQFSTKTEYGLRAMVVLAEKYPETNSIAEISEQEGISQKYLERIIQELRKSDLVVSFKGKSGGYVLSRNPREIRVSEIVESLEGSLDETKCTSKECASKKCPSKKVWITLGREVKKTLYKIKLSDLLE
ncbi:RrF2 family transcriptional regulator [Patescibacteria group bacterium]